METETNTSRIDGGSKRKVKCSEKVGYVFTSTL